MSNKPDADGALPESAVKKVTNLVTDARMSIVVGLIPVLGLIFILRLVQWYLLRKQYPALAKGDAGVHSELAKQFQASLSRLWFAVLFWPVMALLLVLYLFLDLGARR